LKNTIDTKYGWEILRSKDVVGENIKIEKKVVVEK